MSNSKKFITAVVAALTVVTFAVPAANAQSTTDLQAQIAQLLAQIAQLQGQLNTGSSTGSGTSYSFTRDLTVGSTGADVKALQQFLNGAGFQIASTGAGSPGKETTYFGPATKSALIKWQTANGVKATGYFGPLSRAKVASTGGSTNPGGVVIPSTGMTAVLSADNPTTVTLPGSATNVPFLKFRLLGTGTVNQVVVQRIGAGKVADFSNLYLYDGDVRLTSARSLNSSTHQATFTGLNLAVSGEKVLTVRADMATGTAGDRNAIELVSIASTPTVSGLPLVGNEMAISGASAGTLTITKIGSLTNPNVGQTGAMLTEFSLAAANEDVKVSRISLYYAGSMAASNLSNLVMKNLATGETVATSAGVNSKNLAVFSFTTPYLLAKGDTKNFVVYGDIAGTARKSDTIEFYVDAASDVYGIGQQYGYGAGVTNNLSSSNDFSLTLQGANFTVTFNGPNAGDIQLNGKGVTLFDFNMASANNVEVRKLVFTATLNDVGGSGQTIQNMKVVDVGSGVTLAGPASDVTATGDVTFNDVFNINAGETKHLKVVADIPADNKNNGSDTVTVTLKQIGASDIKNIDNNTFVAQADISPNAAVPGNLMTVKAPTLEVNLAGLPSSQNFVKGTQKVPFVGVSLRATGSDLKLTSMKISGATASGSTTANINSDLLSVGLYDGDTLISTLKSFTGTGSSGSPSTLQFTNLNYTIPQGTTKVLTVKADLSSGANVDYAYALGVANVADTTGVDLTAVDPDGREPVYSGVDAVNTLSAPSVKVQVLSAGSVTVVTAPDDVESQSSIITANTQGVVLGKFRFTASNEAMKVTKMQVLVNSTNSATATSTVATKDLSNVYLYDGSTLLAQGVPVGTGSNAGIVYFENSNGLISLDKNVPKVITVKADTNSIANGAASGDSIYASIMAAGFNANGTVSSATTITAATGKEKVLYKTKPTVTVAAPSGVKLGGGSTPVIDITVTADAKEQVSVKTLSINAAVTGATVTAPSTSNVTVLDMSTNQTISLATVTGAAITGGNNDDIAIYFTNEVPITAGNSKTFRISLTFSNVSATAGGASVQTKAILNESSKTNATSYSVIVGAATGENPSFVWSDNSAIPHSETSADWANGYRVQTLPSQSVYISN